MGYFSNLDQCDRRDGSYYGYEEQREARLHELYDRLDELIAEGAPYRTGQRLSEADYLYALPCDFSSICDVERAISVAAGCSATEIGESAAEYGHGHAYAGGYDPYGGARGEVHQNQMSIFEVVLIAPVLHTAA